MAGLLGAGTEEIVSGRPSLLDTKQDDGSMSALVAFWKRHFSVDGLVVTSAERVGIFHNPGGLPASSKPQVG